MAIRESGNAIARIFAFYSSVEITPDQGNGF